MSGINYEAMQASISALQVETSALRLLIEDVKKQSDHHDKILVRGYEDHLPLAEIVRNLTKTVSDYIAQKDKEEQLKKQQWDKVKWIVITPILAGVGLFTLQVIIFFVRVYPLLEQVSP